MIERIHSELSAHLRKEVEGSARALDRICDSPIEVALCLSLLMFDRVIGLWPGNPLVIREPHETTDGMRVLVPQFPFEGKRIDLMFQDAPDVRVFIECDGHDFHERTREQARRDRQRDRFLQRSGTPVLRFTGSEIFRSPVGCAEEVFEFISEMHTPRQLRGTL